MKIPETKGTCPHCGAGLLTYNEREWKYGSPIRTCKICKKEYIDKRYHEIVIEDIAPDAMSIKKDGICILIGLFLIMIFLIHSFIDKLTPQTHSFSYTWLCFGMIGLLVVIFMIIDIIAIKTGLKDKRLGKLRAESVKRLQNCDYARKLADAGYPVPEEYLQSVL